MHEAKASFSSLIDRVVAGETVMICRRNVPVAEVRPISREEKRAPRPIGLAAGEFVVPASFHDALPDDVQGAFEGRGP